MSLLLAESTLAIIARRHYAVSGVDCMP